MSYIHLIYCEIIGIPSDLIFSGIRKCPSNTNLHSLRKHLGRVISQLNLKTDASPKVHHLK